MGKDKKVLLMYPPNQLLPSETPRSDGSLGLPYLVAALEQRGMRADILDASVGCNGYSLKDTFYRRVVQENGLTRIGMSFEEIAQHVVSEGYDVVGINSNFTPQTSMVFKTAEAIKKANPEIKVITGGVNARAMKERFLRTGYFDGLCITEGELVIPEMVEALREGRGLSGISGVAYVRGGIPFTSPVDKSCFPASLDDLAMPDWGKLPLDRYDELGVGAAHGFDVTGEALRRNAPIMTSRGCPFKCAYCHISFEKPGESGGIGNYRMHSLDRVLAEIDTLQGLGVGKLYFEDDSLLADQERVSAIFRNMKGRGLSVMDVNGVNLVHLFDRKKPRVDGKYPVNKEFLEILRDGGFRQIVFPLESGSLRVQKKYATNKVLLEKMDLVELMRTMTDVGIKAPVNTMVGFPDETEEEMRMSIDLSRRLREEGGAPYVDIFFPIPFPGTQLYEMAVEGGHLDRNFNPDNMNWKHPTMQKTTVAPERIEEIVHQAILDINTPEYLESRKAAHLEGQ